MRSAISCITYNVIDKAQYKRFVSWCVSEAEDLNDWLIAQEYALAYQRYSQDYAAAEDDARTQRRGIWQGKVQNPADYRRAHIASIRKIQQCTEAGMYISRADVELANEQALAFVQRLYPDKEIELNILNLSELDS